MSLGISVSATAVAANITDGQTLTRTQTKIFEAVSDLWDLHRHRGCDWLFQPAGEGDVTVDGSWPNAAHGALASGTLGLTLAAGVFLDAFVVRLTLIPAIMSMLGDRMWLHSKWFDRYVPDLDIEGAALDSESRGVELVRGR